MPSLLLEKSHCANFLAIVLAIASSTGGQNSPFLIHLTCHSLLTRCFTIAPRVMTVDLLAQYARLYSTESS